MPIDQATDGDITIESNHETSDQIQLAFADTAGDNKSPADAEPPSKPTSSPAAATADPAPVDAAPATEETPATDAAAPEDVPERLRKKNSTAAVQSAIAKQRKAEHRAKMAEDKLAQFSQAPPTPPPNPEALLKADGARYKAMPGAPKVADFEDYEDYSIALTTFVTDMRQQERAIQSHQQHQEQAFAAAQEERSRAWQTRLSEARSNDPNFDATLDPDTPMSLPMQHLTMESPVGTALLQYLSTHQADSQRLSMLHPVEAYREMGKLEERLSAAPSTKSGSVRVDVSHAKPPIKPLGTSPHTPDPHEITDDMSFEEHFRRMNAADRKRGLL